MTNTQEVHGDESRTPAVLSAIWSACLMCGPKRRHRSRKRRNIRESKCSQFQFPTRLRQVVCEVMSAVQTSLVQSYTDTPEYDGPSVRAGAEPAAVVSCRCDRKDELQPDSLNAQKSKNKTDHKSNTHQQHGPVQQHRSKTWPDLFGLSLGGTCEKAKRCPTHTHLPFLHADVNLLSLCVVIVT